MVGLEVHLDLLGLAPALGTVFSCCWRFLLDFGLSLEGSWLLVCLLRKDQMTGKACDRLTNKIGSIRLEFLILRDIFILLPRFPLRLIRLQGILRISSFLLHELIISQLRPSSNSKCILLLSLMNILGNVICLLLEIIIRIELIYSIMLFGLRLHRNLMIFITALGGIR